MISEFVIHSEIPEQFSPELVQQVEELGYFALDSEEFLHVYCDKDKVTEIQMALYIATALAEQAGYEGRTEFTQEEAVLMAGTTFEIMTALKQPKAK